MLVLVLGDGLENQEIMEFGVLVSPIMKSGFYYTVAQKMNKAINTII